MSFGSESRRGSKRTLTKTSSDNISLSELFSANPEKRAIEGPKILLSFAQLFSKFPMQTQNTLVNPNKPGCGYCN